MKQMLVLYFDDLNADAKKEVTKFFGFEPDAKLQIAKLSTKQPEEDKDEFKLGNLVVTQGVCDKMNEDDQFINFVYMTVIDRYARKDWGEITAEEMAANKSALFDEMPGRVFGKYTFLKDMTVIYIVTEPDRQTTIVMLEKEY